MRTMTPFWSFIFLNKKNAFIKLFWAIQGWAIIGFLLNALDTQRSGINSALSSLRSCVFLENQGPTNRAWNTLVILQSPVSGVQFVVQFVLEMQSIPGFGKCA